LGTDAKGVALNVAPPSVDRYISVLLALIGALSVPATFHLTVATEPKLSPPALGSISENAG
jgi:hypothetical protein